MLRAIAFALALAMPLALTGAAGAQSPALDAIVKAANEEGQLLVHDSLPPEDMAVVLEAFNKRYPGIKVDYVSAGSAVQIISRVLQETRANATTADAVALSVEVVPDLEKQIGISNLLRKVDWEGLGVLKTLIRSYPTADQPVGVKFNSGLFSIVYNNKLVSGDLKWDDLLDPKWKGKIGLSTTVGGFVILSNYLGEDKIKDYLTRLVNDQQAQVVARTSEILPALTTGELSVGVVSRTNALDSILKGAPISFSTADLIADSGTVMAVPVKAEHPNAAILYISWLVSEEGQTVYDKATNRGLFQIPGTWAYQNRDKLQVVTWPPEKSLDEYGAIAERLNAVFPTR